MDRDIVRCARCIAFQCVVLFRMTSPDESFTTNCFLTAVDFAARCRRNRAACARRLKVEITAFQAPSGRLKANSFGFQQWSKKPVKQAKTPCRSDFFKSFSFFNTFANNSRLEISAKIDRKASVYKGCEAFFGVLVRRKFWITITASNLRKWESPKTANQGAFGQIAAS